MAETITITCNDDGSYNVASTEDDDSGSPADQPLNETVKTVDEVLQLVRQELSDDTGQGPKAAWDAEAAQRDATGQRAPMGGAMPAMSM